MYDTGAEGTGLAKDAVNSKVKIKFDGLGITSGTGGKIESKTNSINKIQIGNLVWEDEFISTVNKKLGKGALAIVGYSLFSDKIVEIDYDKKLLIIHEILPILESYEKIDSKFSYVPYLKTKLKIGKKVVEDYLLLDTGGTGTIFANKDFMEKYALYDQLQKISEAKTTGIGGQSILNETLVLPELKFLNHSFQNIPITVESQSNSVSLAGNLIGMDLLKRFNTIIDYQHNQVYLNANSLINEPFKKPFTDTQYWLMGLALLVVIVLAISYLKRKRILI
jgi:hypothetical protein